MMRKKIHDSCFKEISRMSFQRPLELGLPQRSRIPLTCKNQLVKNKNNNKKPPTC